MEDHKPPRWPAFLLQNLWGYLWLADVLSDPSQGSERVQGQESKRLQGAVEITDVRPLLRNTETGSSETGLEKLSFEQDCLEFSSGQPQSPGLNISAKAP